MGTSGEKMNDKKLEIFYNYSKPYKKGYYYIVDGEIRSIKDGRKSKDDWVRIDEIITNMSISKRNLKKIKYCDPSLIEILFNEKGMDCVNEYLNQLQKGRRADREFLGYNMNYNLKSVLLNPRCNLKSKLNILNMVRKNRHVANVDYKFTTGRAVASFFAAIGLALGFGPKLLPGASNQNNKDYKADNKNAIVESLNENETAKHDIEYSANENENIEQEIKNKQYINAFNIFSQQYKDEINAKTQEIINNHKEQINKEKIDKQENVDKQEKTELQFGSVLKLPEGTKFMEGVSGGRVGTIGDDLSPSDGVYVIDYAAEISDINISCRYSLDGKIEKNNDAKQYVHISYVAGAKTIDEAKEILKEQKQNVKDGETADKNVIRPRGWISQETVQKIYEKQNNKEIDDIER